MIAALREAALMLRRATRSTPVYAMSSGDRSPWDAVEPRRLDTVDTSEAALGSTVRKGE